MIAMLAAVSLALAEPLGAPVPVPPRGQPAAIVDYTSYGKITERLVHYEGGGVVLLLDQERPPQDIQPVLAMLDRCAEQYRRFTLDHWPTYSLPGHEGKGSIAIVGKTCGAGCGAGGRAELTRTEHHDAIERVGSFSDPVAWNVAFYELGRGGSSRERPKLPFYGAFDATEGHLVIGSAFPEFVASRCSASSGRDAAAIAQSHREVGYPRVPGPAAYAAAFAKLDRSWVEVQQAHRPGFDRNWALAGLLNDLHAYGGDEAVLAFLAAGAELPAADSHERAAANVLIAADQAGGPELVEQLSARWRIDAGPPQ